MAFYLGMDAGGSRTRIAISEDGRELARIEGESVKTLRVAQEDADARLGAMLEELGKQAGVDLRYITRSCVGLSGASVGEVRGFVASVFARRVGGELDIVGDHLIALDAAFKGGDGILVIAGTGSNVGGRFGRTWFNAGGWGPMLGDEGSGHWIGLEAVKAGLRALDATGEISSVLTETMRLWGANDVGELVAIAHRPGTQFSTLAPIIASSAAEGDIVATNVLELAGEELAAQVAIVATKMRTAGFAAGKCGVAYTGSVLGRIDLVRNSFINAITHRIFGMSLVVSDREVDALDGALWRASRE